MFAIARSVSSHVCHIVKIERVNSAAAIIDTKLRQSMLPETLSGYVLAGQYKKEFLKGRQFAADFLREEKWQLETIAEEDALDGLRRLGVTVTCHACVRIVRVMERGYFTLRIRTHEYPPRRPVTFTLLTTQTAK